MSWDWSACAERQTVGSATRKQVLLAIASRADADGYCWPSYADIAARTELSKSTVRRALEDLEVDGFVTRESRYRKTKNGRWERDNNGWQLHLDWSLMTSPPMKIGNAEDSEGVVTVSTGCGQGEQGVWSQRAGGVVTVSTEPVIEPVTEPKRMRRREAAAQPASSRSRRIVHADDTTGVEDEAPAFGSSKRDRANRAVREQAAVEQGTSGWGLAKKLQILLEDAEGPLDLRIVDVKALARRLNDRHRAGEPRDVQQRMVEMFARSPLRYTEGKGDQKGWVAFLAAAPKLAADVQYASRVLVESYDTDPYAGVS